MSTTGLQYILPKVFQAINMNRGKNNDQVFSDPHIKKNKHLYLLAVGIFRSLIKYSWSVLLLSICYSQWTAAAKTFSETVKNTSSTQFVTFRNLHIKSFVMLIIYHYSLGITCLVELSSCTHTVQHYYLLGYRRGRIHQNTLSCKYNRMGQKDTSQFL